MEGVLKSFEFFYINTHACGLSTFGILVNYMLYCTLHTKKNILAQKQLKTSPNLHLFVLFNLSHASMYIGEILARYTALLYMHVHKN